MPLSLLAETHEHLVARLAALTTCLWLPSGAARRGLLVREHPSLSTDVSSLLPELRVQAAHRVTCGHSARDLIAGIASGF